MAWRDLGSLLFACGCSEATQRTVCAPLFVRPYLLFEALHERFNKYAFTLVPRRARHPHVHASARDC
jgi:hypothetical protein